MLVNAAKQGVVHAAVKSETAALFPGVVYKGVQSVGGEPLENSRQEQGTCICGNCNFLIAAVGIMLEECSSERFSEINRNAASCNGGKYCNGFFCACGIHAVKIVSYSQTGVRGIKIVFYSIKIKSVKLLS